MTDDKLTSVQHYTAFTRDPLGGNRAGVVLDAAGWSEEEMQRVATAVGYSETAFVIGEGDDGIEVRYFSPASEVPFCGHATIALAVALAEQRGAEDRMLRTRSGPVPVRTSRDEHGAVQATLTSVKPRTSDPDGRDLNEALDILGWKKEDLHSQLPPRVAFAGASHLILVAAHSDRLGSLDYEYDRLRSLVVRAGWSTVHLVWPHPGMSVHTVRNAFPAGVVKEDPATGAAAAAYGGYLRELRAITPPARLELRQGEAMGRPSVLYVDVPEGDAGISVSGYAVAILPTCTGSTT
ncbi:MAG: PhzF family phenazine biosynthesis isomerase [Chloroflexota bacterium]